VSIGTRIIEAIVLSGLADSNGDAKQAIKNKSISLNEVLVDDMGYELQEKDFIG
jgi:ribosomal protein S4